MRYRIGDQYGLINTFTIEDLTPQRYNQVELIRNKEYLVRLDEKMTFILPLSGTLMLDVYDSVKVINMYIEWNIYDYNHEKTALMNTYFICQKDGKRGVFNYKGQCLLPILYEDITAIHLSLKEGDYEFIVKLNGKYGIVNQNGLVLVPIKYDSIEHATDNSYSHSYKLVKNKRITHINGDDPRLTGE